jgi:hypothetical protein
MSKHIDGGERLLCLLESPEVLIEVKAAGVGPESSSTGDRLADRAALQHMGLHEIRRLVHRRTPSFGVSHALTQVAGLQVQARRTPLISRAEAAAQLPTRASVKPS